jgi:hypothetical protein
VTVTSKAIDVTRLWHDYGEFGERLFPRTFGAIRHRMTNTEDFEVVSRAEARTIPLNEAVFVTNQDEFLIIHFLELEDYRK